MLTKQKVTFKKVYRTLVILNSEFLVPIPMACP